MVSHKTDNVEQTRKSNRLKKININNFTDHQVEKNIKICKTIKAKLQEGQYNKYINDTIFKNSATNSKSEKSFSLKLNSDRNINDRYRELSDMNNIVSFEDIEKKIFEDLPERDNLIKVMCQTTSKDICNISSKETINEIKERFVIDSASNESRTGKIPTKKLEEISNTKKLFLTNTINVSKEAVNDKIKISNKMVTNKDRIHEISKKKKLSLSKHEIKKEIIDKSPRTRKETIITELKKSKANLSKCSGATKEKRHMINEAKHNRVNNEKLIKDKKMTNEEKKHKDNRKHNEKLLKDIRKNKETEKSRCKGGKTFDKPNLSNLMERAAFSQKKNKDETPSTSNHQSYFRKKNSENKNSECESDDFGEFDELEEILNAQKLEKESVQIELESTNVMWGMTNRKKKSRQEMMEDYLRKSINRRMKEVQENIHKTHVLCLIAHGRYVNSMLNSEEIMAGALSLITTKEMYPEKRLSIGHLELVIKWYRKKIQVTHDLNAGGLMPLKQLLLKGLKNSRANTVEEFTLMFLALLRVLGINGRLVFSLAPLSWKISTKLLIKPNNSYDIFKKKVTQTPTKTANSYRNNKISTPSTSRISSNSSKRKRTLSKKSFSSDTDFATDGERQPAQRKQLESKRRNSESKKVSKKHLTYWIEVFCEEEEEWISLDVFAGEIHRSSHEFESKLSPQCGYILAYKNDLTFKDVTKRYVHNWLSCKNKVRFNNEWWEESISSFRGTFTKSDVLEDEYLDQFLEKQPLPKTLSSYKNHPLYALQRHLLKFEALYPPNVSPVGYFRGEPVFARACVKQLYGREKWIKEAKTVIVDEEPYKVVKARPKWDRARCQVIKDIPLEIFGEWQVEDYEPPVATNGKVPRNEYGNVELFKPSMLPKGCVHINVVCINKVARKLGIDCAPAITGFDFHGGYTHPVCEGYIICEEMKDSLMDAWRQEQVEAAKREEEKRLREIYGNWKKLFNGVLIRERMKEKYGDVVQKDTKERKAKKRPRKKIKLPDSLSVTVPHNKKNVLKVDFASSAATVNKKQSQKRPVNFELDDSSEEEPTIEEKQEKIRTILSWNPDSSQNPNLSDSEEEKLSVSMIENGPSTSDIKWVPKKKLAEDFCESLSSDSSTDESGIDLEVGPIRRTKRSRSRITYEADSDSDAIFKDSGEDENFQPEMK